MSFQPQKFPLFSFIFLWEMRLQLKDKLSWLWKRALYQTNKTTKVSECVVSVASSSMIASAEDEQTEECDATASQNNESPSETGDSDADPNYSLSDDSYSDTSDNKSSSFDKINVSALNEPQNIDLTTDKENRKPKNRKRKRTVPLEWGGKKTDQHTEPLKEVLKYLNGRYLVGLLVD